MCIASVVRETGFSIIRENLEKLRESIDRGFFQDALRYAIALNKSSGQLAGELMECFE
jgi:hypothetical protein